MYFTYLVLLSFVIEVSSPAVKAQVQIAFRQNAERVKPSRAAGERIGDYIRGAQVSQRGLENLHGVVLRRKASTSGGVGHFFEGKACMDVAGRLVWVYGVEQCAAANDGIERLAGGRTTDRVIAIR